LSFCFMSQTPNFDKAINEILSTLKPHQRTCPQCGQIFDIFKEDIDFYKIFKVPPPTLCPDCRLQRRLGYRINFLPVFYKKTCSAPGHNEKVISFYSETNPIKIYDYDYWYSDSWDPLSYGQDYDWEKPFFQQWQDFILTVPNLSIYKDPKGINSDYIVSGLSPKSCYFSAAPIRSENIYYSSLSYDSQDCMDVLQVKSSRDCYDSAYLFYCFNCFFCYECQNCLDCFFLFDCRNCQHCFGSSNLRNKKYYFFNQPLSKEAYEKTIANLNLGKRAVFLEYQKRFGGVLQAAIHENLYTRKAVHSTGNDLWGCKNCFLSFYVQEGCENLRYCTGMENARESMDFFGSGEASYIYESSGVSFSNRVKFSLQCRYCLDVEYSVECKNCEFCFGCFGLKNQKFCVFNKQCSEQDYWPLLDKIKNQMLQSGEYGEAFPLSISWVPYNDSSAIVEFPLSENEVKKRAWHWQDDVPSELDLSKFTVIQTKDLPDDITDVSDDILNKVIICEQTQKPFRLTRFELDFYRKHNLSLPTVHPLRRIKNRFVFRHPYRLWQYPCSNCGKIIYSGWDPAKGYKVYCETCYLKEVV